MLVITFNLFYALNTSKVIPIIIIILLLKESSLIWYEYYVFGVSNKVFKNMFFSFIYKLVLTFDFKR